jgi:hypothetical protein
MTALLRISVNIYSFVLCATEDFILMHYFFISVYSGMKFCPPLLDITGIPVLPCNFKNSSLFTATCKTSPSARCVSAANLLCQDVENTSKPTASVRQILRQCVTFLYQLSVFFLLGLGLLP